MLRRRSKASANNVTVASPEVPTRMLNGGMSLSAIFKAGQLSPQARLTATNMTRAVASSAYCGARRGTLQGSGRPRGGKACVAPARAARAGAAAGKNAHPVRAFRHVAPQLTVCYGTARFSRAFRARRRSPRRRKVPLNFKGLAPTVRDGAEPAESPQDKIHVSGEHAIISVIARRYATALF